MPWNIFVDLQAADKGIYRRRVEQLTKTNPHSPPPRRSAAELLVRQLEIQGIEHIFCVPGESFLAVLDALIDSSINVTVCRHEGGAAMMAEAIGKLTGRPAACFVTRGPGASNATQGLHIARQDSTPLLLFIGQVERHVRGREAWQELDYDAVFGSIAKWVAEITDAERIPEIISRAMHMTLNGRPGPVVVALPEDLLSDISDALDCPKAVATETYPNGEHIQQFQAFLEKAEKPLAIVGGSRWTADTVKAFAALAERWRLPVAVSMRRQMLFPADHDCFAGDLGFGANPRLVEHAKQADLLLLLGTRMSEVTSQNYSIMDIPKPRQSVIHVHADPLELGRVYRADLAINATPCGMIAAMRDIAPPPSPQRSAFCAAVRQDFVNWNDTSVANPPGAFQPARMMQWLGENLPEDAIICNGAGNYAIWVHRFHRFRAFGTQLAPTSGSMGYGVPAAVAAKRLYSDRMVIAFAGDGCFLMNGQEFATAVQYDLPIIVIVMDNGMYGTIRMHQERQFPGRVIATDLRNPDFAAYARAFGGHGERVERTEEFGPAFERALSSGKPAIIHCLMDPEAITPSATLSEIRARAHGK